MRLQECQWRTVDVENSRAAIQFSITMRMENRHLNKSLYTNAHIGTIVFWVFFFFLALWCRLQGS